MAVKNSTILERIWLNGSNDYQQRVPNPTQARISKTISALNQPMNGVIWNQFTDGYINLIGQQRVLDQAWTNPLYVFKGASLRYGSTIQESAVNWIKAHAYDDAAEDLLKLERPEAQVFYHSLNRQDKYPISINRTEVMQAFRDEYGLNRLINAVIQAPINSDNYDEYRIMMQLIAEYDEPWGFFREVMPEPTDEATGKAFLTRVKALSKRLAYPSARYNSVDVDIPVFAKPSELVLLITPEADAALDVETLAGVFQLDKAELSYRKIVVDEFPLPNVYALLTTDAFFVVDDVVYQTDSFYDPNTLSTKYILHHWEIVSASPFCPAILFASSGTNTAIPTVTQTVTALNVTAASNTVEPGGEVQLTSTLNGTLAPTSYHGAIEIAPDSVEWSLAAERETTSGETTTVTPVQLDVRTYVDRLGVLHVQDFDLEAGDTITVTGTSTYINPSGDTSTFEDDVILTVE